jgi:hypothetical protein
MQANDAATTVRPNSAGTDAMNHQRLSDDKIFHLLQNERRRAVIRYLRDEEGTVSMRDIAEQVAAWEHDTSVAALDSDERQRVYIPLYQNHLPKLDEEGVIEYNQSRGTVERTPVADQLEQYLTEDLEASTSVAPSQPNGAVSAGDWTEGYIGATALSGVFFLGAVFNVPAVSDLLLASLMLVTFATVTFLHATADSDASLSPTNFFPG